MATVLTLHLKKRPDGGSALTLERADGSRTWQRQDRHAQFFAGHDLTHFAVESELGVRNAFYGLVADGWDFEHFDKPWSKGPLPAEALWVESLVGLLDVERAQIANGSPALSLEECNAHLDLQGTEARAPRRFTAEELRRIRDRRDGLLADWRALPPGETLVLRFAP